MAKKDVTRDEIVRFCQKYLNSVSFSDYCTNGLQVEGAVHVSKIVAGVSWSLELVQHAVDVKAEMVLVHHGLFANMLGQAPHLAIKHYMKKRLNQLLLNNISLVGFHLPLDAHPVIGNNASLCKLFGIKKLKPFSVGFIGELGQTQTLKSFVKEVDKKLNTNSIIVSAQPKKIKRIAVVSGGASSEYLEAYEMGADTLLCGDIKESVVKAAEETGINIINAGHYNTEKLGVQNLAKLISKHFGIKSEFFDVPCEI